MEVFLEQQDERVAYSRKLIVEAHQRLAQQVNGEKCRADKHDADEVEVTEHHLPYKQVSIVDLIGFMLVALNRRDIVFVLMAFMAVALLGMLTPYVTKQFVDEMIPSGQDYMLLPLGCLLVSATLGKVLFTITRTLVIMRVRDKMNIRLNAGIMDRVYHLPTAFFKDWSSGNLGQRIINMETVMSTLTEKGISMVLSLVFAITFFYQVVLYAPSLLGVSIASFILQVLLMIVYLYYAQEEGTRVNLMKSKISGFLFSIISGIQRIKSSGAEERAYAKWAMMYADALIDRAGRNTFLVFYPAMTALVTIATTILTYYLTVENNVLLSDYVAYVSAFGMVSTAITMLAGMLPELTQLKPVLDQCKPILDTLPEVEYDDTLNPSFLSGAIEINGLKFKYHDSNDYVINNLTLKIKPREFVAIVGKSGCGKSTLVRLLLGFEKPESGSIFYDSYNIENVNVTTLRQKIGTCLQNGKLFNGDIFSNITVSAPLSTQDDVWEAVRLASLEEEIKAMGMGLHTMISEGGGGISGGQRQRILIARALVGKPSLLIFDEATSALDNITQKRVTDNLESLNCTRIYIAHRLSTIRHCDRIIVLDDGSVAEEGTFDELMQRKGLFYELAMRQMTE